MAEYLVDLNATQAAIRAGYSSNGAEVQGHRLLSNVKIAAEIAKRRAKVADKLEVTVERIIREYARLGFSDMRRLMEWGPRGVTLKDMDDLDADDAACVAEVSQTVTKDGGTLRLKTHDKKGALDSLSRHLGMFVDKMEHTGKDGTALIPVLNVTTGGNQSQPPSKAGGGSSDSGD